MTKIEAYIKSNHFVAWLAVKHHRTHKNKHLDFCNHPYIKSMLIDESKYQVDKKSTQAGITEINSVRMIAKAFQGLRVFSVWPTDALLRAYVQERFSKSLLYTPYYQALINAGKTKNSPGSVHIQDIGSGNICFVPSNTESAFVSYPADVVDIEEVDECNPDNIKRARERLDHSEHRIQYKLGNPKFVGMGIDAEFEETDKKEWGVKCECKNYVFFDWFKNVVRQLGERKYEIIDKEYSPEAGRDIGIICERCGRAVNRRSRGIWVPMYPGREKSGRHTSKLFAGTSSVLDLWNNFQAGLIDPVKMQRFYNADLGLAFIAEGSKISPEMISACCGDYIQGKEAGVIVAGVDVGTFYHFVICKIMSDGTMKTLLIGKTVSTEFLIDIMKEYNVTVGVIDALPETREARKICAKFKGFFLCYFGNTKSDTTDPVKRILNVQRTPALDAVKEALILKAIIFPAGTMANKEFVDHMTASVRVFDEKREVYDWVHGSRLDHFFLAISYILIARRLIILIKKNK